MDLNHRPQHYENNNHIKEYEVLLRDLNKSPYGEEFAMKLYQALSSEDLIAGRFEQLWEWNAPWNLLKELAIKLNQNRLANNKNLFAAIKCYVNYYAKTDLRKQSQDTYSSGDKSTSPLDKKLDALIDRLKG